MLAAASNHRDELQLLLDGRHYCDLYKACDLCETVLTLALIMGRVEVIDLLWNRKDLVVNKCSPLHMIVRLLQILIRDEHVKCVEMLLKRSDIKINVVDKDHKTPLDYSKNPQMTQLLLSKGAKKSTELK